MATDSLRPLSVGEILDAGVKVLTRHWKPLTLCVVVLVLPLYVLYAVALAWLDPDQLRTGNLFSPTTSSDTETDAAALAGLALSAAVAAIGFVVAFTACFKAVSDAWLGETPEVGRSLRFGLRRAPMLAVLFVAYAIPVAIGYLACLAPGVWLTVAWMLCVPVLLFERVGPLRALGRSYALIKGRWWASLALLVVCYVLVSVLSVLIQLGLLGIAASIAEDSVVAGAVAEVVGSTVSTAITYPYFAAALTILYFDQRARKEGFGPQPQVAAPAPEWLSETGWTAPAPSYPTRSDAPPDGSEEDVGRARWLPPEAPRGPGGL